MQGSYSSSRRATTAGELVAPANRPLLAGGRPASYGPASGVHLHRRVEHRRHTKLLGCCAQEIFERLVHDEILQRPSGQTALTAAR
jgi:hypothetical protein